MRAVVSFPAAAGGGLISRCRGRWSDFPLPRAVVCFPLPRHRR